MYSVEMLVHIEATDGSLDRQIAWVAIERFRYQGQAMRLFLACEADKGENVFRISKELRTNLPY